MRNHFFYLLRSLKYQTCLKKSQDVISGCLQVLRRMSLDTTLRVQDHIAAMRFFTFDMLDMGNACCSNRYSEQFIFGDDSYNVFEDEKMVEFFDTLLEESEEELYARAATISSQPNVFVEF
ncbi:hypothetical protein MAA_01440 [Metarhizium robertsii ARSEF 23]|uniref:Uncharacterized protein n=1 Tax=Metarhizium robertsii (strain ARSEF 23 / ATCC MYA-3075) TaxID=655844 RepID=E9EKG8_METRA|nr:uncharacterized protein MAA_01440 [Metarhizium robertsii ARSEF 23]EFZ04366.1 hypothetical protein MAA_01440 [Metarhizium robertsii ARSEF 23]